MGPDTTIHHHSIFTMEAHPPQPLPQPTGSSIDFDIGVVYIYMLEWSAHIPHEEVSELPMEALALSGYLGNKPLNPSLVISIRMLKLYRRLRLQKPSFSVEAFTKVVCDLYLVSLITTTLPSEYKLIVFRFISMRLLHSTGGCI